MRSSFPQTTNSVNNFLRASVAHIHIARQNGAPVESVEQILAVAGCGLIGDRHFCENPFESFPDWRQLTLVAEEDVQDFCREYGIEYIPGYARRQITTRQIDLKLLIGKDFRIGEAVCRGIEQCQPCRTLAENWTPQVLPGLVNRGGIRAAILKTGLVKNDSLITI